MIYIPIFISAEHQVSFEGEQTSEWINIWLIRLGAEGSFILYIKLALLLLLLFLICYITNLIVKKLLLRSIELVIKKTKTAWDDALLENKVFVLLSHIAPAIIIYLCTPFIFNDFPDAVPYILRLVNTYISTILMMVLINFINTLL